MRKAVALLLTVLCLTCLVGCHTLFASQYNENGISHFLNITIDPDMPKQYIGELDGYSVFTEKLDLNGTYFISFTDERLSIKEVIDESLVSIDEWRKYAWKTVKNEDSEILRFENYEILIASGECLIRPLK